MPARNAEVKAYVLPDVKAQAADIYARWGISLSDAINSFLVKSIDVGGLPFVMRFEDRIAYDPASVIPADPCWGSSVLPESMDDDEDGLYDQFVK